MTSVLMVKHLNVKVENRTLIRDLSFRIQPATLTCVTGENGVGKTTLMKTILHGYRHANPAVDLRIPDRRVQYVPQFRNVDPEFPLTIKNFVSLSLQGSWLPWLNSREKRSLHRVLQATRLLRLANEPLGEASGGEQQRAYLAQALVTAPQLLILDETTASLDINAKVALLRLVQHVIKQQHVAVMFITHDPTLVRRFGDYELHIANRQGRFQKLGGRA